MQVRWDQESRSVSRIVKTRDVGPDSVVFVADCSCQILLGEAWIFSAFVTALKTGFASLLLNHADCIAQTAIVRVENVRFSLRPHSRQPAGRPVTAAR